MYSADRYDRQSYPATPSLSPRGIKVRVRVRDVGQCFACCGELVAGNNRVMGTTRDFPYGMRSNAYQAAVSLAERLGLTVLRDEDT